MIIVFRSGMTKRIGDGKRLQGTFRRLFCLTLDKGEIWSEMVRVLMDVSVSKSYVCLPRRLSEFAATISELSQW